MADSASESDSSSIDGGPIMMPPSPVTREQLQKRIESLQQHNRVLKVELETYKLRVKALQEENRNLRQASVIIVSLSLFLLLNVLWAHDKASSFLHAALSLARLSSATEPLHRFLFLVACFLGGAQATWQLYAYFEHDYLLKGFFEFLCYSLKHSIWLLVSSVDDDENYLVFFGLGLHLCVWIRCKHNQFSWKLIFAAS